MLLFIYLILYISPKNKLFYCYNSILKERDRECFHFHQSFEPYSLVYAYKNQETNII